LEEAGHTRYQQADCAETNERLVEAMDNEIVTRLAEWKIVDDEFTSFEGSEWDNTIGELALEWGAKVLYCLRDEMQIRRSGYEMYLEAYEGQTLAWQCVQIID
jgi:hypothetical protein